jgi:hypothetical protein
MKTEAPRRRGRPPKPEGPMSDSERSARSKTRLIESGGYPLKSINLSPEAAEHLRVAKEALGIATNKEAVEQGLFLLAKKAARK